MTDAGAQAVAIGHALWIYELRGKYWPDEEWVRDGVPRWSTDPEHAPVGSCRGIWIPALEERQMCCDERQLPEGLRQSHPHRMEEHCRTLRHVGYLCGVEDLRRLRRENRDTATRSRTTVRYLKLRRAGLSHETAAAKAPGRLPLDKLQASSAYVRYLGSPDTF